MKCAVTVSMDEDLIKEARDKRINVSGTLNSMLRDSLIPKQVDINAEQKLLDVVKFGNELGLSEEFSIWTEENLDNDITKRWEFIKGKFNPTFNLFSYIEIRNKFRERFSDNELIIENNATPSRTNGY